MIIPDSWIIAMFGSDTQTEYRKRGVQPAFLQRRRKLGASTDCEFAVIVTQGGSASERNAPDSRSPTASR